MKKIEVTTTDICKEEYKITAIIEKIENSTPVNGEHCYDVFVSIDSEKNGTGKVKMSIRMNDLELVSASSIAGEETYFGLDHSKLLPAIIDSFQLKVVEEAPTSKGVWEEVENTFGKPVSQIEVTNELMGMPEDKSDEANDLIFGKNNW